MDYGFVSVIPIIIVLVLGMISRRTWEPLLAGSVVGFIFLHGTGFFKPWLDTVFKVMSDPTSVWLILGIGFFGGFIELLEKSGGVEGFGTLGSKLVKTKSTSLIVTWILGLVICIDDYLNALAVGTAMRNVTDKHKIPREFLAYVVNSTGAAVCVLVPFTPWAVFMTQQLEITGVTLNGSGTEAYYATIPYQFYAWIAVIIVPLIIYKIIPIFGPMKKAIKRAEETGQVSPNSEQYNEESLVEAGATLNNNPKVYNFLLPMVLLAVVTIITDDIITALLCTFVFCAVLYIPQKIMTLGSFFDNFINGFKNMVPVTAILICAFFLKEVNEALGLNDYIIQIITPIANPAILPAITFIILAILAFSTGNFYGLAAITIPILIPLAQSMGVNIFLVSGAIISGCVFGSHACFYGDAVTLSCVSSQIKNSDYVKTALPIIFMQAGIAVIAYLIFGFIG